MDVYNLYTAEHKKYAEQQTTTKVKLMLLG
jgi:hypothetical protein